MQLFTFCGLIIAIFAAVAIASYLIGKLAGNDDDFSLQWLFACMAYAVTVALFIMSRT